MCARLHTLHWNVIVCDLSFFLSLLERAANSAHVIRIEAPALGKAHDAVREYKVVHVPVGQPVAGVEVIQQVGGEIGRRFHRFLQVSERAKKVSFQNFVG